MFPRNPCFLEEDAVQARDRRFRGAAEGRAHRPCHRVEPLQVGIDLELRVLLAGHEERGPREVHLVLGAGDHVDELAPVRLRHSEDLGTGGIIPILDRVDGVVVEDETPKSLAGGGQPVAKPDSDVPGRARQENHEPMSILPAR